MNAPTMLDMVTREQLVEDRFYFVLTTSLFGAYAKWTGVRWAYLNEDVEHIMAYGDTQIIYEAPQP